MAGRDTKRCRHMRLLNWLEDQKPLRDVPIFALMDSVLAEHNAICAIKPMQMVRHVGEPRGAFDGPFTAKDTFVYLGETEQMPGHGTFVRYQDSQVFINYHTDAFERIPEEEV